MATTDGAIGDFTTASIGGVIRGLNSHAVLSLLSVVLQIDQVIVDFTKAKSDGDIIQFVLIKPVVSTIINESLRTALECALRSDGSAKQTVIF